MPGPAFADSINVTETAFARSWGEGRFSHPTVSAFISRNNLEYNNFFLYL